jgi:hypothetical protein
MPVVLALLCSLLTPVRPAPTPGEAVVRRAWALGHTKWFHTATFVQRTVLPLQQRVETWYESLDVPGKLRIDVAPAMTGRAVIYRNDSTYEFGRGQLRAATPGVEPLLVLLHDLHTQEPAKTIAMLKRYGFDLSRTHETTWEGAPVIVVGAWNGDSTSNQFWLEKSRLLLVRLIERNGSDPRRPLDAHVGGYTPAGGGWLERSLRLYLGGELTTAEDYADVVIDPRLPPEIFEPVPYRIPAWVGSAEDVYGHVPNALPPGIH